MTTVWKYTPYFKFCSPLINKKISVLIPVRNEAENISVLLNDLSRQSYPHFEVIIINDNSYDNTLDVIENTKKDIAFPLRVLNLDPKESYVSHKKAALSLGIKNAKGEIILTTDGDCRVQPNWIRNIHSFFEMTNAKLVSGAVTFHSEQNLFEKMQTVEFASLIATGAVGILSGYPSMCNGANLAYIKKAFYEVGGFEGNEHIASGDDEFLMHKIHDKYNKGVKFLKDPESIVTTKAQKSIFNFFQQRKRWGSKWRAYKSFYVKLLALFIYSFHLIFTLSFILFIVGIYPLHIFLIQFIIKISIELVFLKDILTYCKRGKRIKLVPLVERIYPFYIIITGLFASIGSYQWKDRNITPGK